MVNNISRVNKSEKITQSLSIVPYSAQGLLSFLPAPVEQSSGWPWTEQTEPLPPTMEDGKPWPKISIVTPSYNQGEFIEETIRSVLLQNYPNLEYIIMDGGSTDKTQAILKRYSPCLSHIVSEPDGGQSDAIATGFEIANGELLAWLCSDDLYLQGSLEWLANQYIISPKIDLFCGAAKIDQGTGWFPWIETRYKYSTPTYAKLIARGQSVQQPACFWTKRAYQKTAGIDRTLKFCMDYDLLLKLCQVGKAKYVDRELAWIRIHPDSKSSTLNDIHNLEQAHLVEKTLTNISLQRFYLCTLSYLCTVKYFYNSPNIKFLNKIWKTIRLLMGYLYHMLNGDIFRWHPIHGFLKAVN